MSSESENRYDRHSVPVAITMNTGLIPIEAVCALWVAGVALGFFLSMDYQSRPAASGSSPAAWPNPLLVESSPDRSVLLMFLHPHCPCSRASLSELATLVQGASIPLDVHVLFFEAPDAALLAEHCPLFSDAQRIPGVHVQVDFEGTLAKQFGIAASGGMVLYDERGDLRFAGGITAARGHVGTNPGAQSVLHMLQSEAADVACHPVFGCPISVSAASGGQAQ